MSPISRTVLVGGFVAGFVALGLTGPALADMRYLGASGPVVLPTDDATGRPLPDDPRAVPVPSVMNGGGFGLTGTDYFTDSRTEGRLDGSTGPREYVLRPARIGPQDFRR